MINKVILVGNVGKDPEVRYLDGGVAVGKFPFATSETYKNKTGERIQQTEWHNLVLWRAQAEFAEKYIKKGMQLFIEGRIRSRSWEDKEGNRRYITEIYGETIRLLTRKSEVREVENDKYEQKSLSDTKDKTDNNLDDVLSNEESDDLPF